MAQINTRDFRGVKIHCARETITMIKNKLPMLIVILFVVLVSYLPFRGNQLKRELLLSKPDDIMSIELLPVIGSRTTLVRTNVIVNDRDVINSISKSLNEAKSWSPIHPKSRWDCVLILNKKEGRFGCLVSQTSDNGLLITIYSNHSWGWDFGEYRSDSLEHILEQLASQQKM